MGYKFDSHRYITRGVAAEIPLDIQLMLFESIEVMRDKVEELDYHQAKQFSTSSLITRTTNDITQTQMVLAMGMQMIIRAPMTVIVAISKIMHKEWQWSSTTAIGVVVLLATIVVLMTIVLPKFKKLQKIAKEY